MTEHFKWRWCINSIWSFISTFYYFSPTLWFKWARSNVFLSDSILLVILGFEFLKSHRSFNQRHHLKESELIFAKGKNMERIAELIWWSVVDRQRDNRRYNQHKRGINIISNQQKMGVFFLLLEREKSRTAKEMAIVMKQIENVNNKYHWRHLLKSYWIIYLVDLWCRWQSHCTTHIFCIEIDQTSNWPSLGNL